MIGASAGVSAGHPLTSAAALEILLKGGNAFDAGVAAILVGGVVEPIAPDKRVVEVLISRAHPADVEGRIRSQLVGAGLEVVTDDHGHCRCDVEVGWAATRAGREREQVQPQLRELGGDLGVDAAERDAVHRSASSRAASVEAS